MSTTFTLSAPRAPSPRSRFLASLSRLLELDKPLSSEAQLADIVRSQVSIDVIDHLAGEGLSSQELAMVLPRRTLSHRRTRAEPLSVEETDRTVRLARLLALAETVLGDWDKALRWMRKPLKRFNGLSPMEMLSTEAGGRLVEEALVQIDEGYSA